MIHDDSAMKMIPPDQPELGVCLQALRLARGLSIEEMCDRKVLDPVWVDRVESGLRSPTLQDLIRLLDAMDMDLLACRWGDLDVPSIHMVPAQPKQLGGLIRMLRARNDLTLQQLATKAGLSITTIENIEYGRSLPKLVTFYSILQILLHEMVASTRRGS